MPRMLPREFRRETELWTDHPVDDRMNDEMLWQRLVARYLHWNRVCPHCGETLHRWNWAHQAHSHHLLHQLDAVMAERSEV